MEEGMKVADSELILHGDLEDIDDVEVNEDIEKAEGAEDTDGAEDAAEPEAEDATDVPAARSGKPAASRRAILFGLAVVVALSVLFGWLGFRTYQSHQAQVQRSQLLEVARQGALNLTTIDWQHADADVHRIMDGATGQFYDDFAQRSQPFIDVIKKFQSTSVGTVTEAGLESDTADAAQALVAVTVKTSNAGDSDQEPRSWRLRVSVQKVDDQIKVSNVEFVP
jgi:Mce-associated membrane protein